VLAKNRIPEGISLPAKMLQLPVRFYRHFISPLTGHHCRFRPSCSAYAFEALEKHGAIRGSWLAARRVLRCHPWGGCGHDPVP
jgi:putative membrane protein insertion efficiency factor